MSAIATALGVTVSVSLTVMGTLTVAGGIPWLRLEPVHRHRGGFRAVAEVGIVAFDQKLVCGKRLDVINRRGRHVVFAVRAFPRDIRAL